MRRIKDFFDSKYHEDEGEVSFEISLWHVIIPIGLIVMALIIFSN